VTAEEKMLRHLKRVVAYVIVIAFILCVISYNGVMWKPRTFPKDLPSISIDR